MLFFPTFSRINPQSFHLDEISLLLFDAKGSRLNALAHNQSPLIGIPRTRCLLISLALDLEPMG